MSTVRNDGRPHLIPIWFIWLDEKIYVATGAETQKFINLRYNQNVALALKDTMNVVLLEGEAHVADRQLIDALGDHFFNKYEWDFRYDTDANYQLIEITLFKIVAWGDGTPTREFLYVEDAAEGILLASERYNQDQPVNLGSSYEITIRELVNLIAHLTGFEGEIVWDIDKPNGQPRRKLDVSRAEAYFGFKAQTPFEEGLRRTVAWYEQQLLELQSP